VDTEWVLKGMALTGFMQWLLRKAGLFNTHYSGEVFITAVTLINTGMAMAKLIERLNCGMCRQL
jgi:hypothetical protein